MVSGALAQSVEVTHANNPMNGWVSVRMRITATAAYPNSYGASFMPSLTIGCGKNSKSRGLGIDLTLGRLAASDETSFQPLVQGERLLAVKIDDDKPRMRSWVLWNDPETYTYVGHGEVGYYPDTKFLKDLLAGRKLLVEFHPEGENGTVVSEFDLGGLREKFDQQPECR
jgi:hypothetical protein